MKRFINWLKFDSGDVEGNIARAAIIFLALMFLIIAKCSCQTDCMEQQALRLTGVREDGHNDGKIVNYMLASCGLEATQAAYCGATNYTIHLDCGISKSQLPDSPCWSPSWAREDKVVWKRGEEPQVIQNGMSVLLWSEKKGRIAHVGFVVFKSQDGRGWYVVYFSGNTRDPDNRWNPGDGFHMVKLYLTQIYAIADWVSTPTKQISKYHVVKPKETLYRLSVMYGVSVNDLRRWNGITDNGIFVGQELKVSL